KSPYFEIHRRCFPAVLFDLILNALPFIERAQSCALDCGDVDEHVLAATLRLNESIALIRIEPLHRATPPSWGPSWGWWKGRKGPRTIAASRGKSTIREENSRAGSS